MGRTSAISEDRLQAVFSVKRDLSEIRFAKFRDQHGKISGDRDFFIVYAVVKKIVKKEGRCRISSTEEITESM
jgi:hypothetical protein